MTKYDLLSSATEPITLRVIPELAEEIGLNASLVLLQLTFWIRISDNEREGQMWTFQSLRGMKRSAFPFWSLMTIDRAITQLVKRELITVRGDLNKRKGDNTRWFALNPDGLAKLHSVSLQALTNKRSAKVSQNETPVSHFETRVSQNVTTLPESTPEKEKSAAPPKPTAAELPDHLSPSTRHILSLPEPNRPAGDGGAAGYALVEAWCDAFDYLQKYRPAAHTKHGHWADELAKMGATPDEVAAMCKERRAKGRQPSDVLMKYLAQDYFDWKQAKAAAAPTAAGSFWGRDLTDGE